MAEIQRLREGLPGGRFACRGPVGIRLAKRFELRGRRAAGAHELHLVEHPLRVLVQEGELHRPDRAGRGVAAHQRAAQQHVLGAHEHRRALRRLQPAAAVHAAHQHVHVLRPREPALVVHFGRELAEPLLDPLRGLLDERPHRQAPDQSAGRGVGTPQSVRGPSQRHRGRLARTRGRDQDPRPRIGREGELPRVGLHVLAEHDSIDGGAVHVELLAGAIREPSDHSGSESCTLVRVASRQRRPSPPSVAVGGAIRVASIRSNRRTPRVANSCRRRRASRRLIDPVDPPDAARRQGAAVGPSDAFKFHESVSLTASTVRSCHRRAPSMAVETR